MSKKVYLDSAAEREADDIGKKFMNSTDVVGDMSRAYGADLSSVNIHTDDSAARQAAERGVDAFSTGKDVFFGRNVFNQNDPASRGLLAHELSHSLQQGVGGEMGGMTQSAPMGAAQGGFIGDFFRGIFGKKKEEDSSQENERKTFTLNDEYFELYNSMRRQSPAQQVEALMNLELSSRFNTLTEDGMNLSEILYRGIAEADPEQQKEFLQEIILQQNSMGQNLIQADDDLRFNQRYDDENQRAFLVGNTLDAEKYTAYGRMIQQINAMNQSGTFDELCLETIGAMRGEMNPEQKVQTARAGALASGMTYSGNDARNRDDIPDWQKDWQEPSWARMHPEQAEEMADNVWKEGQMYSRNWMQEQLRPFKPQKKHRFRRWLNK